MSRSLSHIRVFVASPGDVVEEREKLDDIVNEFNRTWSYELGKHLDLIKWERDVPASVGADGQDVINKHIDNYNYDIYIGIMWKHFGTPTKREESGTKEEFEIAYKRYLEDENRIRIMFYFKEIPSSEPSDVKFSDLSKINHFKTRLEECGVLYFPYKNINEFERLVREHLSKQIQGWGKSWGKKPAKLRYKYDTPIGWMKKYPDVGEDVNSTTILTDDRAEIRIDIIRLSNSELDQIAQIQFAEVQDLDDETPTWITAYREDPWGIAKGLWNHYKNYLNKCHLKPRELFGGGTDLLRPDGACAFYATNDRRDGPPPGLPLEWYFVWIRPEYGNVFVGIRAQFPPNYLEIYDTKNIGGGGGSAHADSYGGGAYVDYDWPEPLWVVMTSFTTKRYDD